MRPKLVKSDLKETVPARRGAAFPHDREQTPPTRKDRWPKQPGSRSTHVPRAISRGANEQSGGRDRAERQGRRRAPSA
jgi:hypothetical protein